MILSLDIVDGRCLEAVKQILINSSSYEYI